MNLPQTIDQLGEAQARQTKAWAEMLGLEEEMREARDAFHRLVTTLTIRYRDTCLEWQQAKADVHAASFLLDEMVR